MNERNVETTEEVDARTFFENLGLTATRVPTGTSKTPDYVVDGDEPGYIVEVKARFDDPTYRKTLESGRVAMSVRSRGHDRWGADNAREALKQFRQLDENHRRFWVLWLAVKCEAGAEAMFDQAIGTLYGTREIVYSDEATQAAHSRTCLYAVPGAFERWTEIDGAVVTGSASVTLCVNEFSPRGDGFAASALYRAFAQHGGPITPIQLESDAKFLAVRDRTVDRKDDRAVAKHLSEKYELKDVWVVDMKESVAAVLVPDRSRTRAR